MCSCRRQAGSGGKIEMETKKTNQVQPNNPLREKVLEIARGYNHGGVRLKNLHEKAKEDSSLNAQLGGGECRDTSASKSL